MARLALTARAKSGLGGSDHLTCSLSSVLIGLDLDRTCHLTHNDILLASQVGGLLSQPVDSPLRKRSRTARSSSVGYIMALSRPYAQPQLVAYQAADEMPVGLR